MGKTTDWAKGKINKISKLKNRGLKKRLMIILKRIRKYHSQEESKKT